MKTNNNIHRSGSIRLQNWDYRWNAAYFITICTHNREHYFGTVVNHSMQLSRIGVIADILWYEIKNHANHVDLGAFVVMPNHVHGILILNGENGNMACKHPTRRRVACNVPTGNAPTDNTSMGNTSLDNVPTGNPSTPPPHKNHFMSDISPKSGSVSALIRSYKSAVTRHAHRLGFDFAWQSRFYDHIIRNDRAFQTITDYIINNPRNWKGDRFIENQMEN